MAPEELDLINHDRLVFGAVVDVEVRDASIRPQLALGCVLGRGDRRVGPSDVVVLADADQPGAVQVGAWSIGL